MLATLALAAQVFLVAGQSSDTVSTLRNRQMGCVESNPTLGREVGAQRLVATKVVVTGLSLFAMRRLEKSGHPRWAKTLGFAGGAVGFAAAATNLAAQCR